ncbi:MAG: ATP-binding cassette domain-containing protein [Desulfurococcales archaeon]|nr:ATP-binding cassette domain-containing protein [Desulfurococcales archaeon]
MESHAIVADRLVKTYGNLVAVSDVSFSIGRGETFALLGPNGAGKTTTIKMLSTLTKPSSGDALVGGYSVVREPLKVRRLIGLVPQDLTADDEMTGWENVLVSARLYGIRGKKAEEEAKRVLELLGLWEHRDRRVATYSGGMRRKLEIAMSLVHSPEILFLDEPTLGLDVQSRRHLWDYVFMLKRQGVTIMLTTHYMEEAEHLSDRVAIIDHGRIVAEGAPEELKSRIRGDRIHVELADPREADKVVSALNELLGPSSVEPASGGQVVVISVQEASSVLPDIIRALTGYRVKSVNVVKPNLEEVFLELTGRSLREESMDPARFRLHLRRLR